MGNNCTSKPINTQGEDASFKKSYILLKKNGISCAIPTSPTVKVPQPNVQLIQTTTEFMKAIKPSKVQA
jgi:hypothetical protein